MRMIGKWLGPAVLALVLAAAFVGLWKREEIIRLWAVNTLFDEGRIVGNFSSMDRAFLTVPVPRGDGPVADLPPGPALTLPEAARDWIARRAVTSLLVLKDGRIMHESYHLGTGPDDRRISWSMAKSYLSALFGTLVADGTIASLDAPVTDYAPRLEGGAYGRATIRDVLQMSTGVSFDEDYLDRNSDINRMGRVIALGGTMDGFTVGLTETFADPGTDWQYVSIDTHVLGMVIRGATGRSVPELLSTRIIAQLGQEEDAYYLTDGEGVAFVLGGLNLTTRDYARFGAMIAADGNWQGRQVLPKEWIAESTAASAPTDPHETGYGYQWWIPVGAQAGEVMGRGIYGQYLYVNRRTGIVIVTTAADREFRAPGVHESNVAMLRRIAAETEELDGTG